MINNRNICHPQIKALTFTTLQPRESKNPDLQVSCVCSREENKDSYIQLGESGRFLRRAGYLRQMHNNFKHRIIYFSRDWLHTSLKHNWKNAPKTSESNLSGICFSMPAVNSSPGSWTERQTDSLCWQDEQDVQGLVSNINQPQHNSSELYGACHAAVTLMSAFNVCFLVFLCWSPR